MRWVLLLLLACGGPGIGPREGRRAPELGGADLQGRVVTVKALTGAPVLLVFWASWCGPCRREAPAFAALARSYGSRVQLVAINAGEDPETASSAAAALGMTWPVLLDPDGAIQRRYEVEAVPTVLVLDARGVVRYRGHQLPSDIHRLLDGLLA